MDELVADGPPISAVAPGWAHVEPADLLSDAAIAAVRAHPRFQAAVEAMAAHALADFQAQDAATRWLNRDLGCSSLYGATAILDGLPDGVTVARLTASATANRVCSRGRVVAFVQYAQAAGRIVVPPGPEPWVRRRLILSPSFADFIRRRLAGSLAAVSLAAPEVRAALPRLGDEGTLRIAVGELGRLLILRPELASLHAAPRVIFLSRDAGMLVLQHLLVSQPPGRERLLESAQFCRADLSRRYRVSRAHLNKLVLDAGAMGLLTLPAPDRIVFDPRLSEDLELYFAGLFQVLRQVARAMLRRGM